MAVLGFAEVDRYGNVNASSFHGADGGPGGLHRHHPERPEALLHRHLHRRQAGRGPAGQRPGDPHPGPQKKFLAEVESITFSGREAVRKGQEVLYITERAVFPPGEGGITLVEIAHGVDLQRDILDQMDFQPVIPEYIRYMDPRLFRPGPMGLTPEQMEMVDPEYEFWRDLRRPKGEGGESRG